MADCQWLRADVDAHMVHQARAAGVDYRDRFEVMAVEIDGSGDRVRLGGRHQGANVELDAAFVVDASGASEVIAHACGVDAAARDIGFSSRLLYAHFDGVEPFADAVSRDGTVLPPGPYPDDWAAVHHLLDEGWMYALRFDDGVVSAGLIVDDSTSAAISASDNQDLDSRWNTVLSRYPTLASSFATARPFPPGVRATGRLQRRRCRAVGARWAMLPQTFAFFDPLFSTGIAWSLLGVERLAAMLAQGSPSSLELDRYDALLRSEADQQQALIEAAYAARGDFTIFRDVSFLYFACVSFDEIRQRLFDDDDDPTDPVGWRGFLGAGDAQWTGLFRQAAVRAKAAVAEGSNGTRQQFTEWVAAGIESRNLVGLGESPAHLYGIETDLLVERSGRLGLTAAEMRQRLPRLRGG